MVGLSIPKLSGGNKAAASSSCFRGSATASPLCSARAAQSAAGMPPKKRKQSFAGEITTNGKHGWTSEADDFIKQYIEDHGKTAAIWDELAGAMGHARTASAVRSRWYMLCGPSAATGGRSKGGAAKRQRKTPTAPPGAPPAAAAATADGAQPQEQQPEQAEAEGGDSGASPQSDGGLARTSSGRRVRALPPVRPIPPPQTIR